MKETYLEHLITDKNVTLWNKIIDKDSVNIVLWDKPYSELFSNIYGSEIRMTSLDTDIFNHELCHLYINQLFDGLYYSLKSRMPEELFNFVSGGCLQHMANCLEHKLFFNLYQEIGGNPLSFTTDFKSKKGNNFHNQIKSLTLNYLDRYLGNLFSILGDCNDSISYNEELNKYKIISPEVFAASINLFEEIREIGIREQLEDFEIGDNGVVINKTHNNSSQDFWEIVVKEFV